MSFLTICKFGNAWPRTGNVQSSHELLAAIAFHRKLMRSFQIPKHRVNPRGKWQIKVFVGWKKSKIKEIVKSECLKSEVFLFWIAAAPLGLLGSEVTSRWHLGRNEKSGNLAYENMGLKRSSLNSGGFFHYNLYIFFWKIADIRMYSMTNQQHH